MSYDKTVGQITACILVNSHQLCLSYDSVLLNQVLNRMEEEGVDASDMLSCLMGARSHNRARKQASMHDFCNLVSRQATGQDEMDAILQEVSHMSEAEWNAFSVRRLLGQPSMSAPCSGFPSCSSPTRGHSSFPEDYKNDDNHWLHSSLSSDDWLPGPSFLPKKYKNDDTQWLHSSLSSDDWIPGSCKNEDDDDDDNNQWLRRSLSSEDWMP